MAHEQPAQALVVALTQDVASAAYSVNRLQPDALCFALPETAKPLVESQIQPQLSAMPRRWDWIVLPDADSFPVCHQTIARSLPGLLENWGVDPGMLVLDLTGATPAMAAALTLVTMPYASRIVSLLAVGQDREGDVVTVEGQERRWVQANPWDETAEAQRRDGCDLFNRGAFAAAGALFRQLESRVSGGRKPFYRALSDLADGYDLWDRFQYRLAWEKLKSSAKALEMAMLFGGPPGAKTVIPVIKAHAGFLEKLVLDPAEAKELLWLDLLSHAQRKLHARQDPEGAMSALIRALGAVAQRRLFAQHQIKTWDVQPERLPEAFQQACRACGPDDVDGKYKLPLPHPYRVLAELGDPLGQTFLKAWPGLKPLLDAANHAILGQGHEPVKSERVQQLYDVVVKLTAVSESSLPKFPLLEL